MSDDETSWTEEDDAQVTYSHFPEWHPSLFVDVFRTGLEMKQLHADQMLAGAFVTPESVDASGGFLASTDNLRLCD